MLMNFLRDFNILQKIIYLNRIKGLKIFEIELR